MDSNVLRLQHSSLGCKVRAKEIYEAAKRERRELNATEHDEFYELVGLIENYEKSIKALESRQGANSMDMSNTVLPTNGRLPSDQLQRPQHAIRTSRLRAFKDEKTAYDASVYVRALVAREYTRIVDRDAEDYCSRVGMQLVNASTEGSGPGGGYTVPAPLASTIIDVREQVGIARRAMNIQPMTSDTLTMPQHISGLTVYYTGEAQGMQTSDKDWGQLSFVAKKRSVAHQISQELVEDSAISIVDNAIAEMAYALADKEDQEFVNGDGGSSYGGVQGLKSSIGTGGVSTCADGHDTWAEIDIADITAWFGKLPDRYHARMPVIICSSAFYHAVLLRLHAQAGGNSIVSLQGGDRGLRNFLGFDVLTTPYMPTTSAADTVCAFFGAFNAGCVLADRTGIRLGRSDDFAFLNDLTTLKATSRYDMLIHDAGDDTSAGSFVAIKTAAAG